MQREVKYKVEYIPVEKLKFAENNPRIIHDEQFEILCKSIKDNPEYFETRPVLYNKDFIVFAGNMRLRAAIHNGQLEVPAVLLDVSPEKEKELMIRDNVQNGVWSADLLAAHFESKSLEQWGVDLSQFGVFDEETSDKEEEVPDIRTDIRTIAGDLYIIGNHRILCGSSTVESDIEKLMDGRTAKMIFSSPPYNMGADLYKTYSDDLKSEQYIDFNIEVIEKYKKFLKGFVFWNISYNKKTRWEFIEIMYRMIKETGLQFLELIVWNKKHAMPIMSKEMLTRQYEDILVVGDDEIIDSEMELLAIARTDKKSYFNKKTKRALSNYWEIGTNKTQIDNHKACFPVALPVKGISILSQDGDIVVDPFLGSGSTMVAAQKLNRTCYGMEMDPAYVDVCIRRMVNLYPHLPVYKNGQEEDKEAWK